MVPFSEFSASREKRVRPERQRARIRFLIPGILWIVFFLSLGYLLFFSVETTIRDISFVGNEAVSLTTLQAEVERDMQGKRLFLFPKNNFFFVPKNSLLDDIRNISPKIRSVTMEKIFPAGIIINIQERPTVIVWQSANGNFLLDEDGYVSDHPNLSLVLDTSYTFRVHDEDGRESEAGKRVAEGSIPSFVGDFVHTFESRFGKVLSHDIYMPLRFSGELIFHVEDGFDILLDRHQSVENTLTTLQAALIRGIPEADQEYLARLDLRTENKVYYTLDSEQGTRSREQ